MSADLRVASRALPRHVRNIRKAFVALSGGTTIAWFFVAMPIAWNSFRGWFRRTVLGDAGMLGHSSAATGIHSAVCFIECLLMKDSPYDAAF